MITKPILHLVDLLRTLKSGAIASVRTERAIEALRRDLFFAHFTNSERFRDPKRLFRGSFKVFSEATEDGMIHEIFSRIGTDSRIFVEIGVADGLECNTAFLLTQGWTGTWIDSSEACLAKARLAFGGYPVHILTKRVTPANTDLIIRESVQSSSVDLLSIDIDSYDYYIWEAINCIRPRVVVVEYNSSLPPHVSQTIEYSAVTQPPVGTIYFGASLQALATLGHRKGYALVGCSVTGVNAFFVRNDLVRDHFCAPFSAENHYEPPRYGLIGRVGHGPGIGRWVDV
jgi:hypothetical protein